MNDKNFKLAQGFLNEFASEEVVDALEILNNFMESLENTPDPEHVEVCLVENIYNFLEKFTIMESNIRSYVVNIRENKSVGSKLDSLYDNNSSSGAGGSYLKD